MKPSSVSYPDRALRLIATTADPKAFEQTCSELACWIAGGADFRNTNNKGWNRFWIWIHREQDNKSWITLQSEFAETS